MLRCNGKPTDNSLIQFSMWSSGKSYESAHMDLFMPQLNEKPKISAGFDYSGLVGINGHGIPTKYETAKFMMKETGCTYESALIKLNMPKFSNDVKILGGVKMYPVKMIHCI